jgi:hypothetical protein
MNIVSKYQLLSHKDYHTVTFNKCFHGIWMGKVTVKLTILTAENCQRL